MSNKFNDIGLVIHCAAEPSILANIEKIDYSLTTSLIGTLNCLKICKKNNCPIIFLSTSRVYSYQEINNLEFFERKKRFSIKKNVFKLGIKNHSFTEDFSTKGIKSIYGSSKMASEDLIKEYSTINNVKYIINRCGVITGSGQFGKSDQGIIKYWIDQKKKKKKLSFIGFGGKGYQVRDVLHIKDLSKLIILQIKHMNKIYNEILNVSGGLKNSISLKELDQKIENILNFKTKIYQIKKERLNDVKYMVLNSEKAEKLYNWRPFFDLDFIINDINNKF